MGIKIKINGVEAGRNIKFLNSDTVSGSTDIDISLENLKFQNDLEFLSNTKIEEAINVAEKSLSPESKEFQALEKIKSSKTADSESIRTAVLNHIASFATGTLANVLAGYITMK